MADKGLNEYIDLYKDLTLVAYSSLLGGQYNQRQIKKPEYNTLFNQNKLNRLLDEESNPNAWVLNYITKQFGGSIALFTTSNAEHLHSIMQLAIWENEVK